MRIRDYRLSYRLDVLLADLFTLSADPTTQHPQLALAMTQAEYALLHVRRYEQAMDPGGIEIRGLDA